MENDSNTQNSERSGWTFLSNHGHVLVCLAEDPEIRGRDIAERVGITERAAQAIISDLVADGYVKRTRMGRRNRYEIISELPLRHPLERQHNVGELARFAGSPRVSPHSPNNENTANLDDREKRNSLD